MSLFIQSANALVSRVSQWVGVIPRSTGIVATAYNASTGVLTVSSDPTSTILVGDFIGPALNYPFVLVLGTSSTTITLNDVDGIFTSATYPLTILAKVYPINNPAKTIVR